MPLFYHTTSLVTAKYEIKRSKFIAHLVPMRAFNETMERVKKEHPKARHIVYAYRHFNEHHQIVENQSDDGEPKGSSGKPTLAVIRGADLINTALLTVRYFGGTKLGIGGLVRAYSTAANMVLQHAVLTPWVEHVVHTWDVPYHTLDQFNYLLRKYGGETKQTDYGGEGVTIIVTLSEEQGPIFSEHIIEARLGTRVPQRHDEN